MAACVKTINNALRYSICDIHNNIIHEVSERTKYAGYYMNSHSWVLLKLANPE